MTQKIAVIDDSSTSVFLIKSVLEEMLDVKVKVDEYFNPEDFFESFEESCYDLIITDLLFFKCHSNGFDLCMKVRETDQITPIIVESALMDEETVKRALAFANEYIQCPLSASVLLEKVSKLLKNDA